MISGVRIGPCLIRVHAADRMPQSAWRHLLEGYTPPTDEPTRSVELRLGPELADAPSLSEAVALRPDAAGLLTHDGAVFSLRVALSDGDNLVADVRFRRAVAARAVFADALVMLFRALAATVAPLDDGLLMHGSAFQLRADGPATLALAPSGHGKSTMLGRLPIATALADDTVLVRRTAPGCWHAYGTPFAGKERLPRVGGPAPLERLLALTPHAPRLSLTPLDPGAAFREVIARTFWFVRDGALPPRMMATAHALAAEVRTARLASSLHHDLRPLFASPQPEEPSCSPA